MEIVNRKARHDYFIQEEYECGIVLAGTEIKAIREGTANFNDSYVIVRNGELYIDGVKCTSDQTFTVAAVDYIFDKTDFPFLKSDNQATTGQLFRDYLIQAIKDECKDGNKWLN